MAKVRILPDRVANQIAAGEVVERPAAVVKELVENALDAGATRVEVEFSHGGRALMRIEDNGIGMTREDALLALERHATSKIAEAGDLDRLATFGFRGEALPSIASVSRFSLQTCEAGAAGGTEIVVNGGRIVHVRDCGRAQGTRIEVTQLFNSVPARRKFLKADATEAAHIVAAVRLHALASPLAAFTLIEDGRVVFRSPTCPGLADRVGEIFGRQLAEQLMVIDASEGGMRLHGLIARPGTGGRSTRHETITYVNRRPVDSRTLSYGLIESYHEVLPKGRYPAAFVFLEIDPSAVDVNVHPSKREVRFRSEASVRSFVIRSVLARLRAEAGGEREAPPPVVSSGEERRAEVAVARMMSAAPSASSAPAAPPVAFSARPPAVSVFPAAALPVAPRHIATDTTLAARWKPIGLAHGVYALFETPAGLVLLDRRGAQERIVFEELGAQFSAGAVLTQRLLLPVVLELDPVGAALLKDRLPFLAAHGFDVAEFGRHTFRLEGVPAVLPPMDAEACLRDLLDGFRDGVSPERNVEVAREQLARLAAARAVRLPAQAGPEELRALVTTLFACRAPHTSPGGRPTHIELSQGELMRRFGKS
ncbi:DNA mismatch repair protein MutL [Verrucomicrobia bacterium IMCC26134]|jgi:DNA mismatch repair protein MutL|nr:DNA mismatch repair protein MutL [Verrucomicrobia bacterium IMCC26134]